MTYEGMTKGLAAESQVAELAFLDLLRSADKADRWLAKRIFERAFGPDIHDILVRTWATIYHRDRKFVDTERQFEKIRERFFAVLEPWMGKRIRQAL